MNRLLLGGKTRTQSPIVDMALRRLLDAALAVPHHLLQRLVVDVKSIRIIISLADGVVAVGRPKHHEMPSQ